MRVIVPILALAAIVTAAAVAAPAPTYTVTFAGSGSEHQLDNLRNIQDSGALRLRGAHRRERDTELVGDLERLPPRQAGRPQPGRRSTGRASRDRT